MSALANRSDPILDAFKTEINKLVWQLFDDIKDSSIPIHISVFHVPINVSIKISNLQGLVEMLVGPQVIDPIIDNTSTETKPDVVQESPSKD